MNTLKIAGLFRPNFQLGIRNFSSALVQTKVNEPQDELVPKVIKRNFADIEDKPKKQRSICGQKVVYVGGYGGIGFAACMEIAAAGAKNIMIMDAKPCEKLHKDLEKSNPDCNFGFLQIDLRSGRKCISKLVCDCAECLGGFEIVVNGAGIIKDRTPKICTDINLLGLIEFTLAAIPIMSKAEGGNGGLILNVASVLGLSPAAFICTYTATKHAVIGFTRACAEPHYLCDSCISHAAICPGYTVTPMISEFEDTFEFSKPLSDKVAASVKTQPASDCGRHTVTVIEHAKNGEAWISDLGKTYPVKFIKYWEPTYPKKK